MNALHPWAKKRFGQHFLRDCTIIDAIVSLINPECGEALVEIGPGRGALTEPVVERSGHLTVIELDRDLARCLEQHPRLSKLLTIYQQDVLRTDFTALALNLGQPLKVFGNLPYNISTPLLFVLFKHLPYIQAMYFMLQAEVVDRLCAEPNSKAYGRLSVLAQYFCQITPRLFVPPHAFDPAPKVDSAVVCLTPYRAKPYLVKNFAYLQRVCSQAFNQRRKTIRNSLNSLFTVEQLVALDIDPTFRAENLTVAQYCLLADHVIVSQSLST